MDVLPGFALFYTRDLCKQYERWKTQKKTGRSQKSERGTGKNKDSRGVYKHMSAGTVTIEEVVDKGEGKEGKRKDSVPPGMTSPTSWRVIEVMEPCSSTRTTP